MTMGDESLFAAMALPVVLSPILEKVRLLLCTVNVTISQNFNIVACQATPVHVYLKKGNECWCVNKART